MSAAEAGFRACAHFFLYGPLVLARVLASYFLRVVLVVADRRSRSSLWALVASCVLYAGLAWAVEVEAARRAVPRRLPAAFRPGGWRSGSVRTLVCAGRAAWCGRNSYLYQSRSLLRLSRSLPRLSRFLLSTLVSRSLLHLDITIPLSSCSSRAASMSTQTAVSMSIVRWMQARAYASMNRVHSASPSAAAFSSLLLSSAATRACIFF
jgi:hypothetical protein